MLILPMLTKKAGAAEGSYGARTKEKHWPLETECHGETASGSLVYLPLRNRTSQIRGALEFFQAHTAR